MIGLEYYEKEFTTIPGGISMDSAVLWKRLTAVIPPILFLADLRVMGAPDGLPAQPSLPR